KGAILEQIGDEQARRATEQIEQIAYQPAAVLAFIEGRLKELGIADLLYFPKGTPSPQTYRRAFARLCKQRVRPPEGSPAPRGLTRSPISSTAAECRFRLWKYAALS